MMRLQVSHSTTTDQWIAERHYLKSTPAGAVLRLEFFDGEMLIGAMMWGRPSARQLPQDSLLQLTRMCFIDETEHCVESRSLAMARKHIRKHYPQIKGLITYASADQGHEGTIYLADGWFQIGRTAQKRGAGWETRNGRTNRDLGVKLKFARSP